MPVFCECCVLSGRGHCVWPITRPEDPTGCGVSNECDREALYGEAVTRKMGVEAPGGGGAGSRYSNCVIQLHQNHNRSLCFLKHYATKAYEGAEL